MFIVALLIIAPNWKQPRRPLIVDKQKVAYPNNGVLLSKKKKGAIKPEKHRMNLQCALLSK